MANFKPTLENEYAYATECQLATLSGLLLVKRSPKSEISRQRSICLRMLRVCRDMTSIEWGHKLHPNFGRVEELIMAADREAALDAWMKGRNL